MLLPQKKSSTWVCSHEQQQRHKGSPLRVSAACRLCSTYGILWTACTSASAAYNKVASAAEHAQQITLHSIFPALNTMSSPSVSSVQYSCSPLLCYCHRRDLKLDNTLLEECIVGPPRLKICDFGFARRWSGVKDTMHDAIGTPVYMSPQVCSGPYIHTLFMYLFIDSINHLFIYIDICLLKHLFVYLFIC